MCIRDRDIRDVTAQPTYKVFAVISKHYTEDRYSYLAKVDKGFDLKEYYFSEIIEKMCIRDSYKEESCYEICEC